MVRRSTFLFLAVVFWEVSKILSSNADTLAVSLVSLRGVNDLNAFSTFKRPEGSCKPSCGMPSGHSVQIFAFVVWLFLEAWRRNPALKQGFAAYSYGMLSSPLAMYPLILYVVVMWGRIYLRD